MRKNKIIVVVIFIYIFLTFKIQINKNYDLYIRIVPVEKIRYLFIPIKFKTLYAKEERSKACKRIRFSSNHIIYLKNNRLYEIAEENNKVVSKLYIPKYEYEFSDSFNLKIFGDDYKYADMLYFSIRANSSDLFKAYITIYPNGNFTITDYLEQKIIELLKNEPDAKFVITECVSTGENCKY